MSYDKIIKAIKNFGFDEGEWEIDENIFDHGDVLIEMTSEATGKIEI